MKLADVTLSYPFVNYSITVTHFTARRSTAIEWLILESLQRVQTATGYSSMSVENFFSALFGITDTQQMILPCLLDLRDIGALQLDSVYDQSDMTQTYLYQLHLTPVGTAMQRDGKLPGAETKDKINYYYNISANKLLKPSKTSIFYETPSGIAVQEIEDAESIAFPAALINDSLEILKGTNERPSWLQQETVIREAIPSSSQLVWKNTIRSLMIGEDMHCYIEGEQNPEFVIAALKGLALQQPDSKCLNISVKDPDAEYHVITQLNQLQMLLEGIEERGNIFFADANYRLDTIRSFTGGKLRVNVRIYYNAKETSYKIERGMLTAFIKESVLPDNVIYLDTTHMVGHGAFSLYIGDNKIAAELAYMPKELGLDAQKLAIECVKKYHRDCPGLLHILRVFGMHDEEIRLAEECTTFLNSIEERIQFLQTLNDESVILFHSKCINDEKVNSMILDVDKIASEITDVASVRKIWGRYTAIPLVKNRQTTVEALLRVLLSNLKESNQLSEVHEFWKDIQQIGKQYIKFTKQDNLYIRLYSDIVINELISHFPNDDIYQIEAFTPFEDLIRRMRNSADRTQDVLDISMLESHSEEFLTEAVVSHRSELEKLVDLLGEWKDLLETFESRIGDIRDATETCSSLDIAVNNYKNLSLALSRFCCEKSLQFKKICVLDTNALMHMPDLLQMLDGKDTMVVIPQIMLTELDGLKKDEDEDIAFQAREAIRQIDNYSSYEWLNVTEQSDPELLSDDLDYDNPDCRIVTIALKYVIHNPIIITDDINMRNIAKSQGILTMTTDGFVAKLQQEERDKVKEKKSDKKDKKRRKH